MKIYTKTGDKGETGLLGGVRVPKDHLAVETCGAIDELNSLLGLARCESVEAGKSTANDNATNVLPTEVIECLKTIQSELFDLGSRVAACLVGPDKPTKIAQLGAGEIHQLERWIDQFDDQLPPLTTFILPSGSRRGCELHLARTICRRAERALVTLIQSQSNQPGRRNFDIELIYLNRLSDLLFVLARFVNQLAGQPETPWNAKR